MKLQTFYMDGFIFPTDIRLEVSVAALTVINIRGFIFYVMFMFCIEWCWIQLFVFEVCSKLK